MKSFPSTLNESQAMYGNHNSRYSYSAQFDVERLKAINLNTSLPVIEALLKPQNINISNFQAYPRMSQLFFNSNVANDTSKSGGEGSAEGDEKYDKLIFYENPLQLPANAIALAKDYDWVYKFKVNSFVSGEKKGDSLIINISNTNIVPSMFNPMFGVSAMGLIRNTPILNDFEMNNYDKNIDDCSIRTLCTLSKSPNSPIGHHRFKYADFMYCKDLGKVSNNHLITLRKFPHPVPDHIGKGTTPQYFIGDEAWQWELEGDVGRLVTWFGTGDNKLEDIAKFSYRATWKELQAEIQEEPTKADDPNSGIIGMISNSLDLAYNKSVGAGQVGTHSILGWLGSKVTSAPSQGIGSNNFLLRNYDNWKIYTPVNTMQSNHAYEGRLEFTHEFNLVFSYELKAYDNINPRSAFLDLIGNILEVTYRRGKFWGGSRKIIGPAQDSSMFDKVNKFIDKKFDEIPGFLASYARGGKQFPKVLGQLGANVKEIIGEIGDTAKNVIYGNKDQGTPNKTAEYVKKVGQQTAFMESVKGMVKNSLGRPQLYAWHSLVSGDDVGLWHVTVGNPKNPILSIGNLILMNSEIQQSGPLGVDDFPTQLKVTVTLKHPRPRDITDIGRMYTGGTNALYHVLSGHQIEDFYADSPGVKTNNDTAMDPSITNHKLNTTGQTLQQKSGANTEKDSKAAEHADKLGRSDLDKQRQADNAANQNVNIFIPTTSTGLPDPSIYTKIDINMMRKNTWSDAMFAAMMQEVA